MGKALRLVVPEGEVTEELVEEYYRRVAEAQSEYIDGRSYDEFGGYNVAMEHLQNGDVPIILEGVMSAPIRGMGRDRFEEIFEYENGDFQRPVLGEEGIEELQAAFEDAIPRLNELEPEGNWEATLARHITMCEFALDHGYEIELSY